MTPALSLPELALLTLRDPQEGARIVLGWKLSREALWTAIFLVGVFTSILTTIGQMVTPEPEQMQPLSNSPFVYLVIAVGGFIATVLALFWTGKMLGGQGDLYDFMTLLLWLQAMHSAAQALILASLLIAPAIGSFIALFVGVATIWIFVNFISVGLQLDRLWRAVFVLILGAIAFVVGLSFLLSLIGVSAVGVPFNV